MLSKSVTLSNPPNELMTFCQAETVAGFYAKCAGEATWLRMRLDLLTGVSFNCSIPVPSLIATGS